MSNLNHKKMANFTPAPLPFLDICQEALPVGPSVRGHESKSGKGRVCVPCGVWIWNGRPWCFDILTSRYMFGLDSVNYCGPGPN